MNIYSSEVLRPCTSCQMCGAVCNKNAISIKLNKDGFYRPVLDDNKCVNCGLCKQVCYKFDKCLYNTSDEELKEIPLYAASAKDKFLVSQATSGGIADIMAKELIKLGYKVIGVEYDFSTDKAISRVASLENETDSFRGSKYIQPYTFDAFKILVSECRDQKFAVFGLPCHIYAVNRYLSKFNLRNNCILIDLYCHGCPSMNVWIKVKDKIKQKIGSTDFDSVNFRSKAKGWGQFILEAKSGRRKYHSTPLKNEFYNLFFSNQVLNESCEDCHLRSTLAYTDIRLGDFWGKAFKHNRKGVSGVSLASNAGQDLFNKVLPYIISKRMNHSDFIPYQSWGHRYKINQNLRDSLLNSLSNDSKIEKTILILNKRLSTKQKAKRVLKTIYYYFI